MLHTITPRFIDINMEISEVDHYRWIFTFQIFRIVLEITFLLNKEFFLQIAYQLLSLCRTLTKLGEEGWKTFSKKNKRGRRLLGTRAREYGFN